MKSCGSLTVGWLLVLGILGVGVVGLLVLLAQLGYSQRGDLWPLPGLFLLLAGIAAVGGWVGLWRSAQGEHATGALLLAICSGLLLGAGVVGIFTVGGYLLPFGIAYALAAAALSWRLPRRLVLLVALLLGGGALTAFGTPYLERLEEIGAPPLPIAETIPAPGAVDVPLDTTVMVRSERLGSEAPVTTSMRVTYLDGGLFWLRPQPDGRGSGSWDGRSAQGSWTFTPQDGFEPCREVGVGVSVSGYRRYFFSFQTACPG